MLKLIFKIAIISAVVLPSAARAGDEYVLEPVVVTGSRTERRLSDAPVATEVVGRQEIEASGASNVAELLSKHTGVEVTSSFRGNGIRLQGLESEYVLLLIDGERVTGRVDGVIDLSRFNTEDIERIEIVKGASSALYGSDALGGVVNIITRRAKKSFSSDVRAVGGNLGYAQAGGSIGLARGDWETFTTAGYHRRDAVDLDKRTLSTNGNGYWEVNVANRTRYEPSTTVTLPSRIEYMRRKQAGISAAGSGAVFDETHLTETFSASLAPVVRLTNASRIETRLQYSVFRDQYVKDQRRSDAMDTYEETRDQLLLASLQYDRAIASHFVTVGLEGSRELLDANRLDTGSAQRDRLALYAQDEWQILESPRLVLLPGVRVDRDTQFGTFTSPKATIRFDPVKPLVLRASYGWGYRAPSFKELHLEFENPGVGYVVIGNPNLEPETSRGVNVGAEWTVAEELWLSASAYRNEIRNLIATEAQLGSANELDRFVYANLSSARTQGLETMARITPVESVLLNLGYTLSHTRDNDTQRMLEGRAVHRGTAAVTYSNKTLDADATVRSELVGPRRFYVDIDNDGADESLTSDPYALVDLNLEKRFLEHFAALAGVLNLLDYGDATYLPIQPRTYFAGAKLSY